MFHRITIGCLFFFLMLLTIVFALEQNPYRQVENTDEPDIDMFIAHWEDSKPRFLYGFLEVRDILTELKGDPLQPSKKGAVLTDLNSVSFAFLKAHTSTNPSTLKGKQQIFYITSGEGTIKSGSTTADLYDGIGVIIPPGVRFSITNSVEEPLTMYIIEEPVPAGFRPNKKMLVKYEYDNKISTNVRRVDYRDWLFSIYDGLSTLVSFNPMMQEPMSMSPPNLHQEGTEEVWIAVKGDLQLQYGEQRRKFRMGSAYKVPENGKTPHTNINQTEISKKLLWMMKVPREENQRPQRRAL